jgi:hypothetical protein
MKEAKENALDLIREPPFGERNARCERVFLSVSICVQFWFQVLLKCMETAKPILHLRLLMCIGG